MEPEALQRRVDALTSENAQLREQLGHDIYQERLKHVAVVTRQVLESESMNSSTTNWRDRSASIAATSVETTHLKQHLQSLNRTVDLLQAALGDVQREGDFLHEALQKTQGKTLPMLRAELEASLCERDGLRSRLELLQSGADPEAQRLRVELDAVRTERDAAVAELGRREVQVSEQNKLISTYLKQHQTVSAALHAESDALAGKAEELRALQRKAEEQRESYAQRTEESQADFAAALDRLQRDRDFFKGKCHDLKEEVQSLQSQLANRARSADHDAAAAAAQDNSSGGTRKRGRMVNEGECAEPIRGDDAPTKERILEFWVTGHEELELLSAELQATKAELRKAESKAGEIRNIIATRNNLVAAHCALTQELEQARDERLRALELVSANEVQNQLLTDHLARLLEGTMSADELCKCSDSIRDHAARSAAANATLVYDAEAQRKAIKEANMLRHDIAQLTSEKERLLGWIRDREEAVAALNAAHGQTLLSLRSIKLGDGSRSIAPADLTAIFKDLQSPYLEPAKDMEHKQRWVATLAKVSSLEAQRDALGKQVHDLQSKALTAKEEREADRKHTDSLVQGLKAEVEQHVKTIEALSIANRRLSGSAKRLTAANEELTLACATIKDSGLRVIELLSGEVARAGAYRAENKELREKLLQYEGVGTCGGQLHVLSTAEAEQIGAALQRHSAAVDSYLELEQRRLQRQTSKIEAEAIELVREKDRQLQEALREGASSAQSQQETIVALEQELSAANAQLTEAQDWVNTLESKMKSLRAEMAEVDQQRQFLFSKVGQVWLQGQTASAKGAAAVPPAQAAAVTKLSERPAALQNALHAEVRCIDGLRAAWGLSPAARLSRLPETAPPKSTPDTPVESPVKLPAASDLPSPSSFSAQDNPFF